MIIFGIEFCAPLVVMICLGLIGFLIFVGMAPPVSSKMYIAVANLLWLLFFGTIIYFCCRLGYEGFAWLMAVGPLLMIFSFFNSSLLVAGIAAGKYIV